MRLSLSSLKISQKLLLSVLSFSVPILMLLYFTVSGISDDINFARLELFGNRLLEPLTQLLVAVPQQQRLSTMASAGESFITDKVATTSNLIEKNLEILEKETQAVGEPLKITASGLQDAGMEQLLPTKIAEQWNTLRSSQTTQSPKQYEDLTQRIRALISRVGDTSNLILDPDLDSYYLMDVTLLALPQAQQRVGEILLFGESLTSKTQLTNEEMVKLEVYAALLQADLDRIKQDVATALQEDKNFYGVLPSLQANIQPVLGSYDSAVTHFSNSLIQLSRTAKRDSSSQNFAELGEDLLSNGSQLWLVTRKEQDNLLNRRIQFYEQRRFIYVVLSLAALVISSFFVYKVSREISDRLAKTVALTKEIARGNLTPYINPGSPDEIGQLLVAIKYMVQDLNSLIRQTQDSGLQVATSATQLLANAKQQELIVKNQVESTDDVVKSANQISQLIEQLVRKMDEVASKSEKTAEFASHGQSDLVHMEEIMQKVGDASITIYEKLQTIKDKGEKINFVVTTITKIADQINILSLNAALEAEKAGKYGLGFAIVAKEIRRLADQTGVAALDIEKMVRETQLAVSDGVTEIDSFINKFRHSVANLSQISEQLSKIIEQVQALSPNFEEVNMAMRNQSENTKSINESMGYLEQGMLQIKDSLQDNFSAIEQLNEAAIGLRERVSKFQVDA